MRHDVQVRRNRGGQAEPYGEVRIEPGGLISMHYTDKEGDKILITRMLGPKSRILAAFPLDPAGCFSYEFADFHTW
jgi:hypothetical protein